MDKFIYVFSEQDAKTLTELGFTMLYSGSSVFYSGTDSKIYVFKNDPLKDVKLDSSSYVYSSRLYV